MSTATAALSPPPLDERTPAAQSPTAGRVFAVDSRPVMRSGLARLAGRALGAEALALDDLGQAAAARRFGNAPPRLLLLGLRQGEDPASAVAAARRIAPIVICVPEQGDAAGIRAVLRAGADGYVLPEALTPDTLRDAVEAIEAGAPALPDEPPEGTGAEAGLAITARCHEVLRSLADGLHDREIAERLGISTSSVRKHVANAQLRLHARTRTQAVARAARDGLL